MKTWSIEESIIRAQSFIAVGVQGVRDVFTHRPAYANEHPIPGCPSPSDCRGFGCAGDCSEALEAPAYDDDPMVSDSYLRYDEIPNPYEPSLTDSELVSVRGLLQERYGRERISCVCPPGLIGASVSCPVHAAPSFGIACGQDLGSLWAAEMFPQYTNSNLAAGARAAGSSPSEVSGAIPPVLPSEGCPDPPRESRLASVRGEGGAPDSGIHTSPGAPQPELAGWLEPAVLEILAEHRVDHDGEFYTCFSLGEDEPHAACVDWQAWAEHVTPNLTVHLAKAIETSWQRSDQRCHKPQ